MEFLKKGNKVVFLGHVIPNGDSFKVDVHLTKHKIYTLERDLDPLFSGQLGQKIHLWLKNDKNSLGGYIPSIEGGYYNFCTLKEYRKQKLKKLQSP
jgi:hypothetical protein